MIMPVVMMVPNMLTLKTFGLLNTPHRGDDALLHLGVRRVPDASGVPRHSERAGGGGADGGLPLVAGAVPRTAADVLGRRCWPSPPSALPTTGTSTCGR